MKFFQHLSKYQTAHSQITNGLVSSSMLSSHTTSAARKESIILTKSCAWIPRKSSHHRFSELWLLLVQPAPHDQCQLNPMPRVCQNHTCRRTHLSSHWRQWAWWLTKVMSSSRLRKGFPPEIQLACAESKTTRTPTHPTQHHRHVAPCRQGQQSAWWI